MEADLDRLKHAVVEIALDARQSADHARVAEAESNAPSRHVVAFRQRKNLHRDVLGSFDLQNAGRTIAVEPQIGVREIVNHHRSVMAREANDLFKKIHIDALRSRVVRERNKNHPRRLRSTCDRDPLEPFRKRRRVRHRQHAGVPLGHQHAVLMNGIRGIRRDHRVARPNHREQEMRERVLGTDGDDGFFFGIKIDALVALVALDDLFAQAGNAFRERIAMVPRIARSFDKLIHDGSRSRSVRVAHAKGRLHRAAPRVPSPSSH